MLKDASVSRFQREKILVTGSSGMLGMDLCHELRGRFHVTGLDLRDNGGTENFISADISDSGAVKKAVRSARPDFIIHAAAWTDVDACELDHAKAAAVNVDGTHNIASVSVETGCPVIYLSTDYVFDGKKNGLYNTGDKPAPLSFYAKTKLEGENIITGLNSYAVIRTGWLYGRNGRNFIDTILAKAGTAKELKVVDDQTGSPTFTRDLSLAIKEFLDVYFRGRGDVINRIYHVTNTGVISWFEYAKYIFDTAGMKDIRVIPITTEELGRPAPRPRFSGLDVGDFEKVTGHKMRNWKEGVKEYLNEHAQLRRA